MRQQLKNKKKLKIEQYILGTFLYLILFFDKNLQLVNCLRLCFYLSNYKYFYQNQSIQILFEDMDLNDLMYPIPTIDLTQGNFKSFCQSLILFTNKLRTWILEKRKLWQDKKVKQKPSEWVTYRIKFPKELQAVKNNTNILTELGQYFQVKLSIWDVYPQIYSKQKNQYKIYYYYNLNTLDQTKKKSITKHPNNQKQTTTNKAYLIVNFETTYTNVNKVSQLNIFDSLGILVAQQIRFNILQLEKTKLWMSQMQSLQPPALLVFNYLIQYLYSTYRKWDKNSQNPKLYPLPQGIQNLVKNQPK